jgi:zinc/manganese transport system ATP-binding protein
MQHVLPGPMVLNNLTLGYERHPAVHHLNLTIETGAMVAIVGPNGAGKSTLIKALAGELKPLQGTLGWQPGQGRNRVAYLPQQAGMDRSFPLGVLDMVAMGLWHEVGAWGRLTAQHLTQCRRALAAVGLEGFEKRGLDTLSGGQFQRALFARMMLQDAPVLLLDEPFSAVDGRTTHDLLTLLRQWHQAGKTVIAVLHDLPMVEQHFPQTLMIARELIAWGATEGVLTPANWQRAQAMHEAFDDHAPVCETDLTTPLVRPVQGG